MTLPCPICDAPTALRYAGQPGYVAGAVYDVRECPRCDASFAEPLRADPAVYDAIYAAIERVPGYARYAELAELVERARDPLAALAASEDVYYAVAAMLRAHPGRVLEIGSGLGYLTAALARAGRDAQGWDVSDIAVERAVRRFGPHYRVRDVNHSPASGDERFDAIVATELIEHLERPIEFLAALRPFVRDGGALLLTTPNKDYLGVRAVWDTEAPPVHLWWFSERALVKAAERAGYACTLFDFTPYNERFARRPPALDQLDAPTQTSVFDAQGRVVRTPVAPEPDALFPLTQSVLPRAVAAGRRVRRRLGLPVAASARWSRSRTLAAALVPR